MADFSQNITNAVNVFAGGPSTKWGQANGYPYTMTWGTSKWGEGESLPVAFVKVIQNSQDTTFDYYRSEFVKYFEIGTMVATSDMSIERLTNGDWSIVFTSDTTNAESRSLATWTEGTRPDATFTCQAAGSTTWSEV